MSASNFPQILHVRELLHDAGSLQKGRREFSNLLFTNRPLSWRLIAPSCRKIVRLEVSYLFVVSDFGTDMRIKAVRILKLQWID